MVVKFHEVKKRIIENKAKKKKAKTRAEEELLKAKTSILIAMQALMEMDK